MKKLWMCLAVCITFAMLASTTPVGAVPYPFNFAIAKSKHGKFKSGKVDGSLPVELGGTNKQLQKRSIKDQATGSFWVRVKNGGPGAFTINLSGDDDKGGYTVQYLLQTKDGPEDITSDIAGQCHFYEIPKKGKLFVQVLIKNVSAEKGSKHHFGIGDFNDGCDNAPNEIVFARVVEP